MQAQGLGSIIRLVLYYQTYSSYKEVDNWTEERSDTEHLTMVLSLRGV